MPRKERKETTPLLECSGTNRQGVLESGTATVVTKSRSRRRCLVSLCFMLSILLVLAVLLILVWVFVRPAYNPSPTVRVATAAVASDAQQCSQIGRDILEKRGGSVVDSAIATLLCVGIHNVQSMGIGGGFFMMVHDIPRNGSALETLSIDAREVAPLAATQDMYLHGHTEDSVLGGRSVGVPGEIRGYYEAWRRFGRLPWIDLFQPTIRLCTEGWEVSKTLGDHIRDKEDTIRSRPDMSELFLKADGSLYNTGDTMRRPKLAKSLQVIAEEGPEAFYTGSLAQDVIADIAQDNGIITAEDLRTYKVRVTEPISLQLRHSGYTVYSPRAPSGGPVLQFLLNVLDKFDLTKDSESSTESTALTYHKIVETFKFGYGLRTRLGDEDFVDVEEVLANMTSDEFAQHIRDSINLTQTQDIWFYNPEFSFTNDSGTSHLSIVGPGGSAVSVTSSINVIFGSKLVGNRTGILFNNQMDDFSTPGVPNDWGLYSSPANFIAPGKRPLSSMCPTFLMDNEGHVVMSIGGAGGSRITTITAFVIAQALFMDKDMPAALDTPRVHHQLLPDYVEFEDDLDQGVLDGLRGKGHEVNSKTTLAVVQGIVSLCHREDAPKMCLIASSDRRKAGGAPDGY